MKSRKAVAETTAQKNINTDGLTMKNSTTNQFSFQTELFQTKPKTKIQHNSCYECGDDSPLDGYRFRLVPLCECCRTEREVEITGNRFERRQPR